MYAATTKYSNVVKIMQANLNSDHFQHGVKTSVPSLKRKGLYMLEGKLNFADGELSLRQKISQRLVLVRIDGIPNILRSHLKFYQIVWLLVFVISSVMSCYLIVKSTREFFKYPVTTSYRMIGEGSSPFPKVSICNLNGLNSDYFVQRMNEANLTSSINKTPYFNMIALEQYQLQTSGRYLTREEKRAMLDMEGFIISCTFLYKPCNMSDFRYSLLPFSTNCIEFNSGFDSDGNRVELRELRTSSQFNELSMDLYVGLPNAISSLIVARGVSITILKKNESPLKNTPSPIEVMPGLGLQLDVKRQKFKQFNQWPYLYSECLVNEDNTLLKQLDDATLFQQVMSINYSYSQDTCLLYCYNFFMSQVCNCSAYWVSGRQQGLGYCLAHEQSNCVNNLAKNKFNHLFCFE